MYPLPPSALPSRLVEKLLAVAEKRVSLDVVVDLLARPCFLQSDDVWYALRIFHGERLLFCVSLLPHMYARTLINSFQTAWSSNIFGSSLVRRPSHVVGTCWQKGKDFS